MSPKTREQRPGVPLEELALPLSAHAEVIKRVAHWESETKIAFDLARRAAALPDGSARTELEKRAAAHFAAADRLKLGAGNAFSIKYILRRVVALLAVEKLRRDGLTIAQARRWVEMRAQLYGYPVREMRWHDWRAWWNRQRGKAVKAYDRQDGRISDLPAILCDQAWTFLDQNYERQAQAGRRDLLEMWMCCFSENPAKIARLAQRKGILN